MQEGTRGEGAGRQASSDPSAAGPAPPGLTPRQIDALVETILGQLFATTGRFFSERMSRLEDESTDVLDELEERRERLEEEIAERAIELREVRRQIDAERAKSMQRLGVVEGLRDLQRQVGGGLAGRRLAELATAGESAEQSDEVIASAQRVADELVASAQRVAAAQRRAEDIEREATERRSTVLAESEALEQQLRDLDTRISRLLSPHETSGEPAAPALMTPSAQPEPEGSTETAESVDAADERATPWPVTGSVAPEAQLGEPVRETGETPLYGAEVADADARAMPVPATPPADASDATPTVVTPSGVSEPAAPVPDEVGEARGEADAAAAAGTRPVDEAETVETPQLASTTVVFHGVRSFQTADALKRAVTAIDGVQAVRVVDFDDRRLTFTVSHTLGGFLSNTIAEQESIQADVLRDDRDRLELQVRS